MKRTGQVVQTQGPIIFGEVLFDRFPEGSQVLGGAPFNVAWHLQGFACAPILISRIGQDEAGETILAAMHEWGMTLDAVQRDTAHATGVVQISLQNGQPSFTIVPDQAYDFIDTAALPVHAQQAPILYHGSLAARNPVSRRTLTALRQGLAIPVFMDVNLRAPWWQRDTVLQQLRGVRWAKLNVDELAQLSGVTITETNLTEVAQTWREAFGFEQLIVTQGSEGAMIITRDRVHLGRPPAIEHIVDTVGAGDAFSAVTLLGLIEGWPTDNILQRALSFAARICARRGATVADRHFYQQVRQTWQ